MVKKKKLYLLSLMFSVAATAIGSGTMGIVLMIVKMMGQILCPVLISHLKAAEGMRISMLMIALLFIINGAAAWIMTTMKLRMSVDS